jgi:hypothetical protein
MNVMKFAVLALALYWMPAPYAQEARERSREALDAERKEHMKERGQARPELSRPVEHKRDARACESARIFYQGYCGPTAAPRWRNPRCRDAELALLQSC